jgi:hypothetical protein
VLTLVEITNARSDTLSLPLANASAGYAVNDIEGLDPVDATLTTSTIAQVDGAQPQNAQRGTRNITMKLGLNPDYIVSTVQSLRSALYDYFMPKANIQMGFYLDGSLYVVTSGQVESFANSMFSTDPEVDISVICYDPDFYSPSAETISENTTASTDTITINYEGTSDAGVIFTLNVDRDLDGFTLYNTAPDGSIQVFNVVSSFVADDIVTITSIPGAKSLLLTRAAITTSALSAQDPTAAAWPMLQKGANLFRAYCSGDPIPYTVTYTAKYGGI